MSIRNKNIGGAGLDTGLRIVPMQKGRPGLFELTRNEAGLLETSMRFVTKNPAFIPTRTTPCSDFVSSSAKTTALLALLPYLAAQTGKILYNAAGVGLHYVDVMVQGAVLDVGDLVFPVDQVPIVSRGTYTVAPTVSFSGGGESSPAHAVARLGIQAITTPANLPTGTGYAVGDILTLAGGAFDSPATIRVTSIESTEVTGVEVLTDGQYSVVPANNVNVTGGSGTNAHFVVTWQLSVISILAGGAYDSVPIASLSVGPGILGAVILGPGTRGGDSALTNPFNPVTSVKDTVEFSIEAPVTPVPGISPVQARACTHSLGSYSSFPGVGRGIIQSADNQYRPLPRQDGVLLSVGDRLLVADGTPAAGVFTVTSLGGGGTLWQMEKVPEMDEAAEFTNDVQVFVAEGSANQGLWQMGVPSPFVFWGNVGASQVAFALAGSSQPVPGIINLVKITIDYRAIELSFEYVAADFVDQPRFLPSPPEYQMDEFGKILLDPATPANSRKMMLEIDSVAAIQQVAQVDENGNITSITDGPNVAITTETWRSAVKFIGTSAEFAQTPAGAMFSVKENTTIKIVPIITLAVGSFEPQS
jgi:hypothetical protein